MSELKNTYMFEVDISNFPELIVATPDEPFMRNAFSFAYQAPMLETATCSHKCNSKSTCGHKCCKGMLQFGIVVFMRIG